MAGIFISYQRDDVAGQVGRLFGRLAAHYGEDFIFMDVESINPGQLFESVIENRIRDCDVFLLAIGPNWQSERPPSKGSKDFVRMELAAAIGAQRPLWPMLIDRRAPLEAVAFPEEFQQVLGSQAIEIRHGTFDTDVEALIHGLEKQRVRPPPSFGRRRVEDALVAAGWPLSWFGAMSRALSPLGVAALAAVPVVAAGWLLYQTAHSRGVVLGEAQKSEAVAKSISDVTDYYETQIGKERRESLRIFGLVTDGQQGVDAADVTFVNTRNDMKVSDKTDSRGVYSVDLGKIDIAENDVVRVEVSKPLYKAKTEKVRYHDDFREFRTLLRK